MMAYVISSQCDEIEVKFIFVDVLFAQAFIAEKKKVFVNQTYIIKKLLIKSIGR